MLIIYFEDVPFELSFELQENRISREIVIIDKDLIIIILLLRLPQLYLRDLEALLLQLRSSVECF